jgi:hypothetical protein
MNPLAPATWKSADVPRLVVLLVGIFDAAFCAAFVQRWREAVAFVFVFMPLPSWLRFSPVVAHFEWTLFALALLGYIAWRRNSMRIATTFAVASAALLLFPFLLIIGGVVLHQIVS